MTNPDNIGDLKAKRICFRCVGETYLSGEIEQSGQEAECSYCGKAAQSWAVLDLAERIETAFEHHYIRTSDQPDSWQERLLADKESDYEWYRDGEPVLDAIKNAAEIPQSAAEDVLEILADKHSGYDPFDISEETEFSPDSYYEDNGVSSQAWQEEWRIFEQSLKTEARFFSRAATEHLASVFGGIDKLKTTNGRRLLVKAGPGCAIKHLYRARVFQVDDKLEEALGRPDLHLGSPPARLASAGRMNARGISVFYGATAARAAIAEVRPPVGSKVAVAKFNITRPLRLLDLTALDKAVDGGSIFDKTLKDRLERVAFLRSLGQRMTRPVMPDDESLDYLATQAIADFLATENEPDFDGIIYQSVQVSGGRNIVLFHKAALVDEIDLPKGTEITVSSRDETEDGWETEYRVYERVPPPAPSSGENNDFSITPMSLVQFRSSFCDPREVTIRIVPESVEVHWIDWVSYRSTKYEVERHRSVKREPRF